MLSRRKQSIRVLNAAIALALSQGVLAQTAQAQPQAAETNQTQAADTKIAQAAETNQTQAADTMIAQAADTKVAQVSDPRPAQTAGVATKGEQVVVTARRREELIQDVPGAVTAFSGAELEKAGISNLTGIADMTPNTTLKTSRATNSTLTAFIRGVGQQDPVAGYEQGVGIYLDDIYLARPQGALADIYDLERIEVLRGPQGTLYGRNTIGGAVKYVTRRLSDRHEWNVKATLGNYGERDLVVKGNVPITDALRIGATVGTFNRDGFGSNVVNGMENYNKEVVAGRFSVEFTPSSSLFIRFAADRTQDDSLPRHGRRLTVGPAPANEPVLDGPYDTRANLYTVLGKQQEVTIHGESLLVDWSISPTLSFKSITASRKGESTAPIDFDSLNRPLFEAPAFYNDKQTSQEFQFTYTGSRLQGVAGVYYMKSNAFNEFDVVYNVAGGLSLYTLDDMDTKTWAVFADASYDVTPTFNVNVGGRYTDDTREARIFKRTYLGLGGSPTLGNPSAVGLPVNTDMGKGDLHRTDTKFTPKLGVGWKFTPGHNLYASYAEGFKGGFFDPRMDLVAVGGANSPSGLFKRQGLEPEEVETFELGLKSALNNGRIQTNIAAFHTDYTNVQIPGSIPTYDAAGNPTGFAGNPTNAGKAKIKGFELEALARVSDSFLLSGMVGYIDAKYKEWLVAPTGAPAGAPLINIAHAAVFQNTPKWSASITGTYEWAMAILGRSGGFALTNTLSYKDKVYQFEVIRPTGNATFDVNVPAAELLAQNAYSLWDASLVWTSRDRKLQVGLIGRNLTDKRYKVAGYPFGVPAFFNTVTAFYGDPRTYKLTASVTF